MAEIARGDVEHLAKLARIALTGDEIDAMAGQLSVILDSVARVQEVAAADVPPTSHAVPVVNVYRPDTAADCLAQDDALAAAPAREDGRFVVPRILDEEQ